MDDILKQIIANKRKEVEALNRRCGDCLTELLPRDLATPPVSMAKAIKESDNGIIAEFKRRSPSKGEIHPMASVSEVISAYQEAGAAACSVLTDTAFFGGSLSDLAVASMSCALPLLRKDFIVDGRQIIEARIFGASTVLLIAAALSFDEIVKFTDMAHKLGLEVLLELHDERELDKFIPEVDMVGVNNRNLGTFVTDTATSFKLAKDLPDNMIKIAESGLSSPADVVRLRDAGFNGFLIGETFMKTSSPGITLNRFINECRK